MKSRLPAAPVLILVIFILAACSAAAPATSNPTSGVPVTAVTGAASSSATAGTSSPGALRYELNAGSEASYRVREQLARLNFPTDAVGRTSTLSGSVVLNPDGSIDSAASRFTVDLSTLQSDSAMRDGYVRRSILQTDQYPQAVFVPTAFSGLPSPLPASGSTVNFKLEGNLTIRDVTKPVTWDVTGTVGVEGTAKGTATTTFTFDDFKLNQPQVPVVLSVENKITLEMVVLLKQAG